MLFATCCCCHYDAFMLSLPLIITPLKPPRYARPLITLRPFRHFLLISSLPPRLLRLRFRDTPHFRYRFDILLMPLRQLRALRRQLMPLAIDATISDAITPSTPTPASIHHATDYEFTQLPLLRRSSPLIIITSFHCRLFQISIGKLMPMLTPDLAYLRR